ncbi:HIT family protein [Streptomyces sp. DSM 44915]|uniref:HIT family protein n=1 Tax=Streptomyces chisholmiae TaxID=3075540 RepID=A0ABU2JPA5_9ACTN|nr:HIT family protein [Streptomyces sp. DSM 44915]MDT0266820.1 HIT family protein [Streptomyces sp. DSM 44915]
MGNDEACVFCAIAHGRAEASVVCEDEHLIAFADLQPVTPGHLLVVPKTHVVGLEDLPPETGARVWELAHRLGRALRRSDLRCAGVNLFLADGAAAFQEVFHFHLHVFPRFPGDSFRLVADWRVRERAHLDAVADSVRRGLAALDGPA